MKHFDFNDEWVEIPACGFRGRWKRSRNGEWLLTHGRIDDPAATSWSSDDESGCALLFRGESLVARVEGLRRPDTAAISDVGIFAIYTHGKAAEFLGPDTKLLVFEPTGEQILAKRFGAAIELLTISSSAAHLAFHTLGAPIDSRNREDGESVHLLELPSGRTLWQHPVPVIWPIGISFADLQEEVVVGGPGESRYRYRYSGEFLDADRVELESIEALHADKYGYGLFELAQAKHRERLSGSDSLKPATEVQALLVASLARQMSDNVKASAHRLLGELALEQNQVTTAIMHFETAVLLNPRIGIKRMLAKLRRGE